MASTAVHRQVGDERHGCCALVSARGLGWTLRILSRMKEGVYEWMIQKTGSS